MFIKALIPATKVVPAAGTARTMGSIGPSFAGYPLGWSMTPLKAAARMTETKVNRAEAVAPLERAPKVRGSEQIQETTATIAEKPMVQTECPVMVLRYFAPTKQCNP